MMLTMLITADKGQVVCSYSDALSIPFPRSVQDDESYVHVPTRLLRASSCVLEFPPP